MNDEWSKFLMKDGAVLENGHVIAIGKPSTHVYSLENTYLCELSQFGVIHATGEDAQSFLHSQFTNDLNNVSTTYSQLSSYCNPKGRMLSIFRIFKHDDDYYLSLPRDVLETTLKKLTMFKLMSKVEFLDESDQLIQLGVAGPDTESVLNSLNISIPQIDSQCIQDDETTIIRLPSKNVRVLFITNIESAMILWRQISEKIPTATSSAWDLHNIYSGIPQITATTSEAFIPQMTNLELIDGVSFSKGCYPGQEVVARTHYLGKPNRRMYRVQIADANAPDPGTNIFSPEDESQPVGKIVSAQQISDEYSLALAVLRIEKENDKNLHLGSLTGANVTVKSLPYFLTSDSE